MLCWYNSLLKETFDIHTPVLYYETSAVAQECLFDGTRQEARGWVVLLHVFPAWTTCSSDVEYGFWILDFEFWIWSIGFLWNPTGRGWVVLLHVFPAWTTCSSVNRVWILDFGLRILDLIYWDFMGHDRKGLSGIIAWSPHPLGFHKSKQIQRKKRETSKNVWWNLIGRGCSSILHQHHCRINENFLTQYRANETSCQQKSRARVE